MKMSYLLVAGLFLLSLCGCYNRYTGNFDESYDDISEGCQAFLEHLLKENSDGKRG